MGTAVPRPTFDALAGFCDGVEAVSEAEYEERRMEVAARLEQASLGALWMEAGPTLTYFTGVRWGRSERPLLACVTSEGAHGFVAPSFERRTLLERAGDVELVTWDEHESAYERAAQLARALEVDVGQAALESTTRTFVREGLEAGGVARGWAAGVDVGRETRIVKSELELARMRRASEATKAALRAVAGVVEPGMREDEVRALVTQAQVAAGLERVWALVLFGANASFPHGTNQRRVLAEDDLVLVDTGGFLHGYASDVTRTWPATEASRVDDGRRTAFDVVLRAQRAAMSRIVAGAEAGEADARAREVISAAGYGGEYETFTHRLGHGIGLEVHEAPYLVRASRRRLIAGMTMSNEPGLYVPGRWGIRIEDIVAVTDVGPEVFGPQVESLEAPFGA
ncbi:MAG: M24 family metallopeptidase [Nannocystaceae bacterium]